MSQMLGGSVECGVVTVEGMGLRRRRKIGALT